MTGPDPDTDPGRHRPPSFADVTVARAQARAAVADNERLLPRRVQTIARIEASRTARRIGLVGAVLAVLASLAIALAAYSTAATARETSAATQQTVATALARLGQANTTLEARGQQPVPAPPVPASPSEAIAAAVLAQVLASLPPSPSADDVAARIQGAVVALVIGPSRDELPRLVSAYFAANPPIPGPPPSEAAIQAAVDRAYAADPPTDGKDGADGQSPPCLAEPAQCRGEDSTVPGPEGPAGPPGPTCPAGTSLQPVRYLSGQTGQGCVDDEPAG